ncbi:endonuclease/exonuclease/phosphatase family protein [Pseudothioclava arenosa]|uniref:Endonuclease n=1 Tax=Pseudothioclava arenosa TaxID=1795308 RepID=A0A2A4CRF0_9RHOB|nr:endonuclease/exonuclease/phosphatase family protein [Pseudothioclava arenosa]PCD76674.1 endonuclease [Pseudothioclava arenosa]
MGIPSGKPLHARHRDGADRQHDRGKAAAQRSLRIYPGLIAALFWALPAGAETLRIASFDPELSRKGPGLLLQDIRKQDAQVEAVVAVISETRPDILLLTNFDWDHEGLALAAFEARLREEGLDYGYSFAPRPNAGLETGLDLDGNGATGEPRDAQGYGRFTGDGGLALLSRLPIDAAGARDFSGFLWADLPDAQLDGAGLSDTARAAQRLSSTAHWDVPLRLPGGEALHLWAFAATPPLFDGPEDRNGRRNHDEAAFWLRYLDGDLPVQPAAERFVLLGNFNTDPVDGEGRRGALTALLADPRLQDPAPRSAGGALAANPDQAGDPALDTAAFGGNSGNLRLDYVLPSAGLEVVDAGVFWPAEEGIATQASRHHLVWVDIALP